MKQEQTLEDRFLELFKQNYSQHRIKKTLNLTKREMEEMADNLNVKFPTRKDIEARNWEMLRLKNEENMSLESIGELFIVNGKPMSKEGVRLAINSVVAKGGEIKTIRGKSPNKENLHTSRHNKRQELACDLFQKGNTNLEVIAKELGVCEKTVMSYLKDLPAFRESRTSKNQPLKSKLSYDEIYRLNEEEMSPGDIASLAGISPPRVLQILQMRGNYKPSTKTRERIRRVLAAKQGDNNISVKQLAKKEGVSEGQIYRYINLGKVLEDLGKL